MNKEDLENKLSHSHITYGGDAFAIEYVNTIVCNETDSFIFNIEGKTGDYDGDHHELSLTWDKEKEIFKALDEDEYCALTIKTPSLEQIKTMELSILEVEKKLQETQDVFKNLGFEKDMVFIHETSDIIEWNSSKC